MGSDHASSPLDRLEGGNREDFSGRDAGGVTPEPATYQPSAWADSTPGPSAPWIATFTRSESDHVPRPQLPDSARWPRARAAAHRLSRVLSSGYRVENEVLYRAWNLILVTPIVVLAAPVMAIMAVMLLVAQGRPILYRGERLGKDRQPFRIYKFRTLHQGAEKITQKQVLPARSRMETRLGRILRDCRLDELPQLFNVLNGSMNLFGPRPVRPGIAAEAAKDFGGYEDRFSVKPGLFGAAQAVMTHQTPKRLRARYNANRLRSAARVSAEPLIVVAIGTSALLRLTKLIYQRLGCIAKAGHIREQRKTRRVARTDTVLFVRTGSTELACGQLVDINDHAFLFEPEPGVVISEGQHDFVLRRAAGLFRRPRAARCRGIVRAHPGRVGVNRGPNSVQGYIVFYGPASPLNAYMIDKYFLMNALVP